MTTLETLLRALAQADQALADARERAADPITLVRLAEHAREQALKALLETVRNPDPNKGHDNA